MGSSKSKPSLNNSEMKFFPTRAISRRNRFFSVCFLGKDDNHDVQPPPPATLLKSQTAEPLKMPTQQTFTCNRCGMIFPSDDMLFKHKAQYCVGGRDPAYANETFYSTNADRKTDPSTTFSNGYSHQTPATKVRRKQRENNELFFSSAEIRRN